MNEQSTHQSTHQGFDSEFDRQIAWEMHSIDLGKERYRESLTKTKKDGSVEAKDLSEIRPGSTIIKDVVSRAAEVIAKEQTDVMNMIADKSKGRWSPWWFPLLSVPASQIAYIGTKAILNGASDQKTHSLTSIALQIGRELRVQHEFMIWKEKEQEREREVRAMKKSGDMPEDKYVPNWWKLMYQLSDGSARAYNKFKKKSDSPQNVDWDRQTRLSVGTKVIELIYPETGGWFEVKTQFEGGVPRHIVRLTQEAWGWVEDQHAKNELRRPWLLPMLVEPMDWVRTDGQLKHIE